uniref:DUF7930 domain-containing protein n=1 Tax=Plectus sambesii TaxID=2011161 RepID=A0A914VJU6_9BILA
MAEKKREVTSTGRITRVQTKFAYLTSKSLGCVFVPPCAALPSECADADMNKYYKTGDIVHFTAIPQAGKNDCAWVATKVAVSTNSEAYQGGEDPDKPTIITDQLGVVMSVNDTFGFLWSDEYGQVFLPGGAYQPLPDEPPRLSVNLSPNDVLVFTARKQSEQNGCCWLALSAAKYNPQADYHAPLGGELAQMPAFDTRQPVCEGYAVIQLVGPTAAVAFCEEQGTTIYCPVLTWTGGERDQPGADSLLEVLVQGDRIHFAAIQLETEASRQWECQLRATRWGPTNVPKVVRKMVRDSYAQTFLTADEMLIRGLEKRDPQLFDVVRNKFPSLIDYARN